MEGETVWLTQAMIAELYQTSVSNMNIHLKNIYDTGELAEAATVKEYLTVLREGLRQVSRKVLHYSLEATLAVGCRRSKVRVACSFANGQPPAFASTLSRDSPLTTVVSRAEAGRRGRSRSAVRGGPA